VEQQEAAHAPTFEIVILSEAKDLLSPLLFRLSFPLRICCSQSFATPRTQRQRRAIIPAQAIGLG
jgi:hypothetical protein